MSSLRSASMNHEKKKVNRGGPFSFLPLRTITQTLVIKDFQREMSFS